MAGKTDWEAKWRRIDGSATLRDEIASIIPPYPHEPYALSNFQLCGGGCMGLHVGG